MVAPTCFAITLSSSGSIPSGLWEMLNWGAVDRILWMGVLCLVTWCVAIWDRQGLVSCKFIILFNCFQIFLLSIIRLQKFITVDNSYVNINTHIQTLIFCWPCIIMYHNNGTNLIHFHFYNHFVVSQSSTCFGRPASIFRRHYTSNSHQNCQWSTS
jgi:hypothetical protein